MGKRMLRGWQGLKAGRGVESGRWGGWTGRRGDGKGYGNGEGETGRGNLKGGNDEGEIWRRAIGMGREWQWGRGQREEEMERGAVGWMVCVV